MIGYRALGISGIQPGGRLGPYGFGASARLAIQVAVHCGCCVFVGLAVEVPIPTAGELHPLEQANLALQRIASGAVDGAAVLVP